MVGTMPRFVHVLNPVSEVIVSTSKIENWFAIVLYKKILNRWNDDLTIQSSNPVNVDWTEDENADPPQDRVAALMKLSGEGKFEQLAAETDALLKEYPRSFTLLSIAISANARLGNIAEAASHARAAVSHHPNMAAAHHNLGISLRQLGETDEALAAFRRATELDGTLATAHFYLGLLYSRKGEVNNAISSFDRAIQLKRDYTAAHFNRAIALASKAEHRAAVAAYSEAIRLKPDFAEAYNNQGVALLALMEMDHAVAALQNAIRLQPDLAIAYDNLGTVLASRQDLPDAVAAFDRAVRLDPGLHSAMVQKLFIQARLCDFSATKGISLDALGDEVTPFWLMSLHDSPECQVGRAAYQWKRRVGSIEPLPLPARTSSRPARLRVGYFSADIHDHATLYLTSGLFREHDRSRFEIFVYSYGVAKEGENRKQIEQADLGFHDVEPLSGGEIANLVRSHNLDIAIDLKGYTSGTRSELFGYRLAPIQVSYLGYPGTMATDAMDYIIADRTVIPPEFRRYYSEKVIYLPHTYQPNDDQREITDVSANRADFGLPENAFVFCCFNNSYKITAEEFDIWMRIMRKVERSVLWMISSNVWMEQNLRNEAASRGIDPKRLVFMEKIPHAEHLARHRHADLFLDTFNYNAHTTASDALWTGVPVVTRQGRQFSARVAASLLNAVGLPELVTQTTEEYERKIVDLATRPDELRRVRDVLARNRLEQPLFDTERYTRNFEKGLQLAYDRHFAGEQPCDIIVPDQASKPS